MTFKSLIVRGAVWLCLVAAWSCNFRGARGDLRVTSHSPERVTEDASQIVIRFNRPVVASEAVAQAVPANAVVVSPSLAWSGHWQDPQTLVVEPAAGALRGSTRYRVELGGDLGRRVGGFGFDFIHRPLRVEGLLGVDALAAATDGELPIGFNQAVRAADVASHCRLTSGDAKVALVAVSPAQVDARIAVKAASPLTADRDYELVCQGLGGDGGNQALVEPYRFTFHTRPRFAVVKVSPTGGDVAADEVEIEIEFSTAVDLDAARAAITSTPTITGLDRGSLDGAGRRYQVTANLDTTTRYVIEVKKGFADVHGQALATATSHQFTTGDAQPRISMERGIYALEAAARGYPLWTRNVSSYQVDCAAIPKERLVQLLTTEMNYDPWGYNDSSERIDWKQLEVAHRVSPITVAGAKNKWHLDDLDFGKLCGDRSRARGVYLAEVSSSEIPDDSGRRWYAPRSNRVLANVTDLGVLLKVGTASGLVWVTSIATGEPVGGARVSIMTPQGKTTWTGVTDRNGLAKIPGSARAKQQPSADDVDPVMDEEQEWDQWEGMRSQRLIAVVEKGSDLAVVDGNWQNGIQVWNFGVAQERRGAEVRIRGFIQSDRGLYRPGEVVHFKGIVREIAGGTPRLPRTQAVKLEVQDSQGGNLLSHDAKLSRFGGFAFDLPLGSEARLGDYYVTATVAGQVFRERFMVEEFRPAAFELLMKSTEQRVRKGQRMPISLEARYLFGAPVAAGKVEWTVRRRNHALRFAGYDQYTFGDSDGPWWWNDEADSGDYLSDGAGTTDERGRFQFTVNDPGTAKGPQDYIISANVTDDTDQTIGKSTVITAHQSDFYLGLHTQEFVQAVGMPFAVGLVAVATDGQRVAASATLSLVRRNYHCTWSDQGPRGYQSCAPREEVAMTRGVQIGETGTATERIYPQDPGEYVIKVEGSDGRGNQVVTSSWIWVIGKGEAFWSGDESARMTLISSKRSYLPGDTARLVAQANLKAPTALITIERDGVLDAKVRKLGSPSEGIELTIEDGWAPNVFASVAMVQGRLGEGDRNRPQFKMGVVELVVSSAGKRLDVAIELERSEVRPGDKVKGSLVVTSAGKPVVAELSLSAADEGVLQLIDYRTPDPMRTFYASWGLGVDSGTNWNRIARLADPSAGDPDEGGDAPGGEGQKVRSRFVSSAYWAPSLVTGVDGRVGFEFDAPDNLTAFRLMAVAADAGDRFGFGDRRITVNKPLMAVPVLPRFFGAGDTTTIGVMIHNHTDRGGAATVVAKGTGLELSKTRQVVQVAAGGSTRVRLPAVASENAAAVVEFAVELNGERDAVKVTLPIRRPRVIETRTLAEGRLAADAPVTAALAVSAQAIRGESEVVVTVDRTGMSDLEPSLRYLVEYPYGCLEQTLSRFVPLVKAKDLAASLEMTSLGGAKMASFINAGVAKVARHQQGDGHFSLWPASQTYPQLTAYAVWGLSEAKKAGVTVPADTVDRGMAALTSWAGKGDLRQGGDGAVLAMTAFLLAERKTPDAGLNAKLFEARTRLPRWGQAFLLRALVLAKGDSRQIEMLRAELVGNVVVSGDHALVREAGGDDDGHWNSDTRATAMTLAALLAASPNEPVIEKLVAGLKSVRGPNGSWQNTQDNLWALVALAEYARRIPVGDGTVTIAAGKRVLSKKKLRGTQVHRLKVNLATLTGDEIEVSSDAPVRYAIRVTESRRDDQQAKRAGFSIERRYLDGNGQEVTRVKAGDMVTVRLTVKVDGQRRWVAMVDPLPAGFEAVNPRLATTVGGQPNPSSGVYWAHQELRDEQLEWFADWMRAGTYEVSYAARATMAGVFDVAPARIEAMYAPEVMGRTAAVKMVVEP